MYFRIPDFPLGLLLATTMCVVGLLFVSPETPSIWLWETLIAVSVILWALGAGLLSKPDKITEPEEGEIPGVEDTDQAHIRADFSALISVIKAEGRANRREERKEDNEGRRREQITIVLIGITMFAIILQVHEMSKAYEPIRDQAKAAIDQATAAIKQASAAAIQAEGVKDQTEAAKQAAVAARENSIAAGRAWVGPTNATMNSAPAAQQDSKIVIAYQNTGREPALGFVANYDMFSVDANTSSLIVGENRVHDNLLKCLSLQPVIGAQVVFPSLGLAGNQIALDVAKRIIDSDVLAGSGFIVVTSCFAYQTFKATHRSAFCFTYRKGITVLPNLNFCPGGGYAD